MIVIIMGMLICGVMGLMLFASDIYHLKLKTNATIELDA